MKGDSKWNNNIIYVFTKISNIKFKKIIDLFAKKEYNIIVEKHNKNVNDDGTK